MLLKVIAFCNDLSLFVIIFLITRLIMMVYYIRRHRRTLPGKLTTVLRPPARTLIIMGSGGHTTEMLKLVSTLSEDYRPRHYVVASTDTMSSDKICAFEETRGSSSNTSVFITRIHRSREVMQSWSSSVISTFIASLSSLFFIFRLQPDLLLCNGPGTCVPVCFAAFISTLIGWKRVSVVFVESVCRATTLSMSGRLLYHIVDEFIVQWPQLAQLYPLSRYIGRLV